MMGGTRKLLRGNYNPTNWKKKKANLQKTEDPKTGKRILACTRCMKTMAKTS
ncbi:MAG: hypothetical protein Q8P01_05960 [bacterium]|nr:hypothetical protein [bacterium]